ncbi:MAG: ATP-dependent RecD-like DNA helicase [Lachnospiraceae bacterium]|nr:ATP-dependent RecD-like DNA helicase [Lachnospiraceae bacterium]
MFNTKEDIPHTESCINGMRVGLLAGKMQQLDLGIEYNIVAELVFNKKYNSYQYNPKIVVALIPKTQEEQINFLKSQVTKTQAENILEQYPNVVEDVMQGKEVDFTIIKGVGEKTWNEIRTRIINNYVISDILVLLQPFGITSKTITKLLKDEPNPTLLKQKLTENPYMLTRIRGIGFRKADEIALIINPKLKVSEYRVKAFVNWYCHNIANDNGDTWLSVEKLDNAVRDNILDCFDLYKEFLNNQTDENSLLIVVGNKVGLRYYYNLEHKIIDLINELNAAKVNNEGIDIESGIAEAERKQDFLFTDEQKEAIRKCCETNVSLISGQAGTGKSSILRALTTIYKNRTIKCCALSAKAANRIKEVTDHDASTIHRLLGYNGGLFKFNKDNRLYCEMLVIDEASMINLEIFCGILEAIQIGTKVIICGDDEQLPPIGCGNIFHDLLKFENYNCCKLTKILRQAEKSGIISDSRKIRQNLFPVDRPERKIITGDLQDMTYAFRSDREEIRELAIKSYMKSVAGSGVENTIIIMPCKQNRVNCTEEINRIVLDALIPYNGTSLCLGKKEFRVGARVIQRVNNYGNNVFNGETGTVVSINEDNFTMLVDFGESAENPGNNKVIEYNYDNLGEIELAYALTIHVTQGSGYDNVIVLIDNSHFKLLDSCLLYTAVTRAKKRCLLIAEPSAFEKCINSKASERKTWLLLESRCM